VIIENRRAWHEYFITDRFSAGIVLTGSEIKSLRAGKANITDGFCSFFNDELFLRNVHISEWKYATINNHVPVHDRKLLLKKTELKKLLGKTKEKGFNIVPIKIFFSDKGLAKLEIALAKGKKLYDKRDDLKMKDAKREIDRRGE
jgi:SsrA-binding protein